MKTGHKIKGFFSGNVGMLNRSRAGNVVMFLFLLIFAIYSALPIVLVLLQSIKPLNELFIYPPRFFVVNPTMDNFKQLPSLMAASRQGQNLYVPGAIFGKNLPCKPRWKGQGITNSSGLVLNCISNPLMFC